MVPRAPLLAAFALVASLAGCLADGIPAPEAPANAQHAGPEPLAFTCPGGAPVPDAEACAPRLTTAALPESEPYAAIDPQDPTRMAIAFQTGTPFPRLIEVHTSTDGGATWTPTAPLPLGGLIMADPIVRFLPGGGLLVGALAGPAPTPATLDVLALRSDDQGETWHTTKLTRDGNNDRPWLTVAPNGTVLALWQTPLAGGIGAAWSHDAGTTWTPETILVSGCALVSEAILRGAAFGFTCQRNSDPECTTRWYEVAPGQAAHAVGCVRDDACGTNLAATDGERILVSCIGTSHALTSADGGRTWTDHGAWTDLHPEATHNRFTPFWMAGDGPGWHVLFSNFAAADIPALAVPGASVSHAAFLRDDLAPHAWTLLSSPAPLAPVQKGEFFAIDIQGDIGLVAWIDSAHAVRYAFLRPAALVPV